MNSQKIFEFLIQAGIGAFLAIIAFFSKALLDYFYLKSPRLKTDVKVRGMGVGAPNKGYRTYGFVLTINIYNNSKNDAYDFELIDFKPNEMLKIMTNPIAINKAPITDQQSMTIAIEYQANLKVKDGFIYSDSQEIVDELDKKFQIKYSFSNALGKKYTKEYDGEMAKENFIISYIS